MHHLLAVDVSKLKSELTLPNSALFAATPGRAILFCYLVENTVLVGEPTLDIKLAWERYTAELPPEQTAISRVIFHQLCLGRAPAISEIGDTLHQSVKECTTLLKAMVANGTVTMKDDLVTGTGGLSVVPTSHHLRLNGIQLYCWCALDTLGIPSALSENAEITSVDGINGRAVNLHFESGRLTQAPYPLQLQLFPPDQTRLLYGGT